MWFLVIAARSNRSWDMWMPWSGLNPAHTLWNVRRRSFDDRVCVVSRGHRSERLNELFRREITQLLIGSLKDPRIIGVSVTGVRVTSDVSMATVFVRSTTDLKDAIEGLEHASGFIRRQLGQSLRLRRVPEFRFVADNTLEHANRIEELLRGTKDGGAHGVD